MALPAVAAALPYAMAGTQALGQLITGAAKKRQANQMELPETDPNQIAMLNEVNRKRQQLEMGTGAEFENLRRNTAEAQAQTQANVLKAAGGNVGATIQGINMAQQGAGAAYAQGSVPLVAKSGQYQMLAKQMVDDIAKRKFEVQQWQKLQKMREAAEATQAGMQNLAPAALGLTYTLGGDEVRNILNPLLGKSNPMSKIASQRASVINNPNIPNIDSFDYQKRDEGGVVLPDYFKLKEIMNPYNQ